MSYWCRDYELDTSPHYRSQKRRFALRCQRKREAAEQQQTAKQQ
jgi:hypothetical protein